MSKRLGRGLEALIPSLDVNETDQVKQVDLRKIRPNPYQPRKTFKEDQLRELMSSIKEHGVIQPIIVRKSLNGYEIVAGERRWRACKELALETIPVVVREFSDQQVMEIALIENLQREDLNPVEIAVAYEKLIKKFNFTQEELALKLGKSRPNVANFLRLLQLPESILQEVSQEKISMGHARTLITLDNEKQQIYFAKMVVDEGWSVRILEEKIKQHKTVVSRETTETKKTKEPENKQIRQAESLLRDKLNTAVKIKNGKNKGKIEIEYYNQGDLERILEMMGLS